MQLTREFLLRHCGDVRKKRQLQSLFDQAATRPLGLLLHDRVINCPPELVPHMHQAFVDDVAWAVENEVSLDSPFLLRTIMSDRE